MHTNELDALSAWLFPKVRMAVLSRLLLDKREWHARELARVTGLNHAAIGKELQGMADVGITLRRRSGNRIYYYANPDCPIHHELLMLVTKTAGLADQLRRALEPLTGRINLAYIYGSMARGEGRSHSDIDLMVVGDVSMMEIMEALEEPGRRLSREINVLVYTTSEYQSELDRKEGFIYSVDQATLIRLIGNTNEFERSGS